MTSAPGPALPALPFAPAGEERALRRPHLARRGDQLFFLESRRPFLALAGAEGALWEALAAEPAVAELRRQLGPPAEEALRRLWEAGACDLAAPPRPGRRRIAVVEPHVDDAALSLGATMWQRRERCEFTVVTLASRSNFTSYFDLERPYFDVEKVTALRRAEGELFARLTGGSHLALGFDEATLRYRNADWTLDWYRRHRYSVSAFIGHRSGEAELRSWTEALRQALRRLPAEELWLPIGVGAHTDHELARNACLAALLEEPSLAEGREVRLYQEVPYGAHQPAFTRRLVETLERAGARLVAEPSAVGDQAFAAKLRLLAAFGSQFKLEALLPGIEACARLAAGGDGRAELLWRLERPPRALDPLALSTEAEAVEEAVPRLARWRQRHRAAPRMRLLLLVPPGRWAEDLAWLEEAFPATHFEVFATAASEAELAEHPSPRVTVHRVAQGPRAWALLSLRLAVSRPAPTAFLAGPQRLALARRLARLWPMSDPVVLPSLGHLVAALRRAGPA